MPMKTMVKSIDLRFYLLPYTHLFTRIRCSWEKNGRNNDEDLAATKYYFNNKNSKCLKKKNLEIIASLWVEE